MKQGDLYSHQLNEQQILTIQNMLLKPGIHTIHVPSALIGRQFIYQFLSCTNWYHDIACYTYTPYKLKKNTLDILLYKSATCPKSWDQFFVEYFDADFIWIEQSHAHDKRVQLFIQKIKGSGMSNKIPVIIFESDNAYYVNN